MEITIKGRHWKPTSDFREYAIEHIERLTRFYPRLIRAELVVTQEGYRHTAELRLHGNSIDLLAKSNDTDPRTALDTVLQKQERVLRKEKDKLKDRRKRGPTLRLAPPAEETPRLPTTRRRLAPPVEETPRLPATRPEIEVIRQRARRPVLSVQEAARALLRSRKPVLVFAERGGAGLRVAYRIDDGQVGLIELDE